MDERTMIEKMRGKEIPEYRDTMYLEGYSPHEILTAARKTIIQEHETLSVPQFSGISWISSSDTVYLELVSVSIG